MYYFACDQNMNFFSNDQKNIDTYTFNGSLSHFSF